MVNMNVKGKLLLVSKQSYSGAKGLVEYYQLGLFQDDNFELVKVRIPLDKYSEKMFILNEFLEMVVTQPSFKGQNASYFNFVSLVPKK